MLSTTAVLHVVVLGEMVGRNHQWNECNVALGWDFREMV